VGGAAAGRETEFNLAAHQTRARESIKDLWKTPEFQDQRLDSWIGQTLLIQHERERISDPVQPLTKEGFRMTPCTRDCSLRSLELPDAFEDLTGVIRADLKVIVTALTERASERLLLSRRQSLKLQRALWNDLTRVISETVEPLTIERH